MQKIKREHILQKFSSLDLFCESPPGYSNKFTFLLDDKIEEIISAMEKELQIVSSYQILNNVTGEMLEEAAEMFIYLRRA